ncbi:DUF2189 domain-containing protein [Bradyrhizobium ontarionense]|uniref:DUF2189 domain-containing protein n=1 Tax=Bradyrhizobium ontarionense TaxID=2898149 RepID=A0ABY3R6R8_9BRAD|nr:DUF2189 domain-containing protein [Bradyrhizobium sp. A19]UFZ02712.1 DUF2189 domain-containing protein [Bradyrhizobium sp. A19]
MIEMTSAGRKLIDAPMDDSDDEDVGFIPAGYIAPPAIRDIPVTDVFACLRQGISDFRRATSYGLLFSSVYVFGGLGLVAALLIDRQEYLIFPVVAGFLLIGPITAVGLYDISRRLEAGEPLLLRPILLSFMRHGGTQLLLFGCVLVFAMVVWLKAAGVIYAIAFGLSPMPISELLTRALNSPRVMAFLLAGNAVGAILATLVFAISVVAVPYLLDKDTDFMTALTTSLRAVIHNPVTMLIWSATISFLAFISVMTGFIGFFVTLPVVGHATWHLYRRVVIHPEINDAP